MPKETVTLPLPDELSRAHLRKVEAYLKNRILKSSEENINFAEFMKIALYEPGLGYYSSGNQKFGRHGDFVTAPEISNLFGMTLALQFKDILKTSPDFGILEFGAGTGKLALDIIKQLAHLDCLPKHYYILEISPELRQRQQYYLQKESPELFHYFTWITALPQTFKGIILANEVLDAMPCHRFSYSNGKFYEYFIEVLDDQFSWRLKPASGELQKVLNQLGISFSEKYSSEINLMHKPWINALSACLMQGVIFLIDYGYPRKEYYHPQRNHGTLRCFFRHHQHENPLILTGIQDITSHVDFTAIAEAAIDANLKMEGYTSQSFFLLNCGITDLLNQAPNEKTRINWIQQLKQLTLPHEMGELFKVMALSRNISMPLQGFHQFDRLQTL